ncbi:MAG: glycosyltransferase [Pseudomonadota bacterium]
MTDTLEDIFSQARLHLKENQYQEARQSLRYVEEGLLAQCSIEKIGESPFANNECIASVIILSHKDSDLISEALSRVAEQWNDEFELVLISNGNENLRGRAQQYFSEFRNVVTPFVVGCSMGRNIGAQLANGHWLMFLDDDGLIEEECLQSLLDCAKATGAPMVRGKIKPLTQAKASAPKNYDLGDFRRLSFLNGEGVSCVVRQDFLRFGGFDPVLAGHEGVELCARMWRFYGPRGFIYEPKAVLLHDYSKGERHLEEKKERYASLKRYVETVTPNCFDLHGMLSEQGHLPEMTASEANIERRIPNRFAAEDISKITVLTTVRDEEQWLDDYFLSWTHQDYDNYEVIVVYEGSTDATLKHLKEIAERDRRFFVIDGGGISRSAALNAAYEAGTGDIFVVAEFADLSAPDRLSLTMRYFHAFSECDIVSFGMYGEEYLNFVGDCTGKENFQDLKARLLSGTAGQFSSYAFRRRFVVEPFDENLVSDIELDWVSRNFTANKRTVGHVVPVPVVYGRRNDASLEDKSDDAQGDIRSAVIWRSFDSLIGSLSDKDLEFIEAISTDRLRLDKDYRPFYQAWISSLIERNNMVGVYDPDALAYALQSCLSPEDSSDNLGFVSSPEHANHFGETVYRSVQHFEKQGDIRRARAILRGFRKGAKSLSGKNARYMLWSLLQKLHRIFGR